MTSEKIITLLPEVKYASIEQAIADIKAGKFVIVADDEGRENEGDLICAADKITPEMVNFMMGQARGMICVAITPERAEALNLHPMVEENTDPNQTAYTVSVDAGFEFGVTTGVSAFDRTLTIQRLATANATALDFRRPGHTFPVTAKTGGVFRRIGHTEAAMDLTRLAGVSPVGVMCEILNEDGSMARRDDLAAFAKKHGISFVTIAQLIQYRLQHERSVHRSLTKEIETRFGTFTAIGYKDALDGCEHLALVKGPIEKLSETVPYVRVQHEDVITDLLGKAHDEMPHELSQSMKIIQENESGVLVYLRHQDDSVHGVVGALKNYFKADAIAPNAYNAAKGDLREYGAGAQILADLGVKKFNMLSQSKKKIIALRGYGLEVVNTVPLATENFSYSLPPKVELPSSSFTVMVSEPQTEATAEPSEDSVAEASVAPVAAAVTEAAETPAAPVAVAQPMTAPAAPEAVTSEDIIAPVVRETVVEAVVESGTVPAAAPAPAVAEKPAAVAETVEKTMAAETTPHVSETVAPAAVVDEAAPRPATPTAQNENTPPLPELKAEPRFATMRMGAQVMSGQALFEG